MTQETDEEIRNKIYKRYRNVFDGTAFAMEIYPDDPAMGAPQKPWIPEAVDKIDRLVATGMNVAAACREVGADYTVSENITPETFEMTYRRFKREKSEDNFNRRIMNKDLDGAVSAYKELSDNSKRKLRLN